MTYQIIIERTAGKEIQKINQADQILIIQAIKIIQLLSVQLQVV